MKLTNHFFTPSSSYGQCIAGLQINDRPAPYPVVNEREIRVVAGLMFAVGFFTLMYSFFTKDLTVASLVIPIFFGEFLLKVLKGPEWSFINLLVGRLVASQKPEYVGAIQKRFAWSLGLVFSGLVWLLLFVFQIKGPLPLALCAVCLVLMWLESAAGICLGCKIYSYLIAKKILPEPDVLPACPGGVCEIPAAQSVAQKK